MEASGWRLKGCGELKRGLKNYQQGRARHPCYPPPVTRPCVETGRRRASERKKEKDKDRDDAGCGGVV